MVVNADVITVNCATLNSWNTTIYITNLNYRPFPCNTAEKLYNFISPYYGRQIIMVSCTGKLSICCYVDSSKQMMKYVASLKCLLVLMKADYLGSLSERLGV